MPVLRSIGVVSTVKMSTAVMAMVGLVAGVLYSFGGALFDALVTLGWVTPAESGTWSTPGLSWGTVLAFGALIGMPLIFAATGLVAGTAGAIIYNLVARKIGGIELRLDRHQ